MAFAAALIELNTWQVQTTQSWSLPGAGVLLVASVLWGATWVWHSYLLAISELELGAALPKQIVAFAFNVMASIVACMFVGHLMYNQLFTWYAARYEGIVAAEISWINGGVARLNGPIGLGTAHSFEAWLSDNPSVRLLELNSAVGLVAEGIHLGRIIQQRGIEVRVKHECVGACVWALLGAYRVEVTDSAHVACHKPYIPMWGDANSLTSADHAVQRWAKTAGVTEAWIDACLATPAWQAHEIGFMNGRIYLPEGEFKNR